MRADQSAGAGGSHCRRDSGLKEMDDTRSFLEAGLPEEEVLMGGRFDKFHHKAERRQEELHALPTISHGRHRFARRETSLAAQMLRGGFKIRHKVGDVIQDVSTLLERQSYGARVAERGDQFEDGRAMAVCAELHGDAYTGVVEDLTPLRDAQGMGEMRACRSKICGDEAEVVEVKIHLGTVIGRFEQWWD